MVSPGRHRGISLALLAHFESLMRVLSSCADAFKGLRKTGSHRKMFSASWLDIARTRLQHPNLRFRPANTARFSADEPNERNMAVHESTRVKTPRAPSM